MMSDKTNLPYIYSSIELRGTSLTKIDLTVSTRNITFTVEDILWYDVLELIKDLQEELETKMKIRDVLREALANE